MPKRFEEIHLYTKPLIEPFTKQHLDIQYILLELLGKKYYLLEARDNLIGFIEAKILSRKIAAIVENFIKRYILLYQGYPYIIVINRGIEFKKKVVKILKSLQIPRVIISPYNSRANRVNKVSYISIVVSLAKVTGSIGKNQKTLLLYILFVDRMIVRVIYRILPFVLAYNYKPLGPIENNIPTWRIVNQDSIKPYLEEEQ